jgi:cytochrome d ubiquinol oxidase subunit I
MVGIGVIMLLVVIVGQVLQLRGRLWESVWFLRLCQLTAPLGFIAVIAGWITTEVGRQPWTVYGVLRTADSVSPSLTGANVAWSLAFYIVVYLVMFPTGIAFMASLVRRGPQPREQETPLDQIESGRPHEPFESAARAAPQL